MQILHPLPFTAAAITGGFWGDQQQLNHSVTLRHGYRMLDEAGGFHNLRLAAGQIEGSYRGKRFVDSDLYKWLEALGYALAKQPDDELRRIADEAIDLIAAAQRPDGYLNTYFQVAAPQDQWTDLDHGHELYCAGHLFQAALAHKQALGDPRLLDVAVRFADHIAERFGPGKHGGAPGHPGIEMALVALYRETGTQAYLDLARFFIDQRGQGKMAGYGPLGPEYHQDRVPLRRATEIEGHAVRAMYLMCGAGDLYLASGARDLLEALTRLWADMTGSKMYITGGVGTHHMGEAFGAPYELPTAYCYCETCAAIGSIMWNWRLLLATGEARFADLMEQTLYNGFLSGLARSGDRFFYVNPLESRGWHQRQPWYSVACCPPNIMRLLASLNGYLATQSEEGLQIHLYNEAEISGAMGSLAIQTDYPWDGRVQISVAQASGSPWTLALRIPGWCHTATASINGSPTDAATPGSYLKLKRAWQPGDTIMLDFEMPPDLIEGHPWIDAVRDCMAIRRGPLVYCLEQPDAADYDVLTVRLDAGQALVITRTPGAPDHSVTIQAGGYMLDPAPWGSRLYRPSGDYVELPRRAVQLEAIPYYLWGDRGQQAMRVWLPVG